MKKISKKSPKIGRQYKLALTIIAVFLMSVVLMSWLFYQGGKLKEETKTTLVSDLSQKISDLKQKISKISQCIDDKNWTPNENDVCKAILFKRKNSACNQFKQISKERLAIGKKNCCRNNFEHAILCAGDDIFLNNDLSGKMTDSYLLEGGSDSCTGNRMCEYYCQQGYYFTRENGKMECKKNCTPKVLSKTTCSVRCGGGTRVITKVNSRCQKTSFKEPCNTESCGGGWSER